MAGKVKRAIAPRVRMAAMAVEVSSSSGSMAPWAAMMAVTPQMLEPMASREVSLGGSLKMRPSRCITREREDEFDGDEGEGEAADVEDVLEEELCADEDDAEFEPELVGGDAGAEDGGYAEDVADGEAEDDGPEDVLEVREGEVGCGGAEDGEDVLEELAQETDAEEQSMPGIARRRRVAGDRAGMATGLGMVWGRTFLYVARRRWRDDVEADERRQGEGDGDGDEVYVEAACRGCVAVVFCGVP